MSGQLNNIERAIGRLEEGILGIQKRLDISNGRIGKSETEIDCIKDDVNKAKGSINTIAVVWGIIITGVNIAISFLK